MRSRTWSKTRSESYVSVSRLIPATCQDIFDVLTNPFLHAEIDGSGTVKGKISGPEELFLGDTFQIKMKTWNIPYRITNTVVEYEKNTIIAWAHFGKHRWRYKLSSVAEGTVVTETFDWTEAIWPKMIEIAKYPSTHIPRMEQTLERLENFILKS